MTDELMCGPDTWWWRSQALAIIAALFAVIGACRAVFGAWWAAGVCWAVCGAWAAGAAGCAWWAASLWRAECTDDEVSEREGALLVRESAVAWGED